MKQNHHYIKKVLILTLVVAGCATPPKPTITPTPIPLLAPSLLEGQTTVTGSGVPNATVEVLLDGIPLANGTVTAKGIFDLEVPALALDQVVTATQTITGQTSPPSPSVIVKRAALTQIEINPRLPMIIEQGQTLSFTATGIFSNDKTEDPLSRITWSIENPTIATVNTEGLATGIEAGSTTIQASREGVQSSKTTIKVKPVPPVITTALNAGDTRVAGTAEPSANIKIIINEIPLKTQILADAQGQWQVNNLPSLNEDDQVTSTQTVNSAQSKPTEVVEVLPNNPPTFNSLSDQKIRLGETLSMKLTATDPDGDELQYQAIPQSLPANSKLDTTTGLFTFTPAADQVGTVTLPFQVSDGYSVKGKTINIDVILPKNVVVLLDNPDGTIGSIQVFNAGKTNILNKAGQAIWLTRIDGPPTEPFIPKAEDIREAFKDALKAKPEDPLKFILYFETDTTKLSPESQQQLPEILSIITSRTAPDIGVIGHTDRTASDEYNHQLSISRATTIRDTIVTGGIDPHVLEITAHGENDPLVETADNISEPLNRRVEIIIR